MAAYRRPLANNRPSHFELLELPATVLGFLRPIVYQRIDVPLTDSNLPSLKPKLVEGRYRSPSVAAHWILRSCSKTIASISKSYIRYRKNVFPS
jgi:hypothetical protein